MMQVEFPESMQAKLEQMALVSGKSVDDIIVEAVEQRVATEAASHPPLTNAEWKQGLRQWAASHPMQEHVVDVSRESIYRGRGE